MCCVGHSEPSAAAEDLSVRCVRASGSKVVPGRRGDCGARSLPALSYRVYLGRHLLHRQPADWISYSKAGDRRAALRRVCLGYDELRGGAAFGHPSLAAKNRYGVNHYGTDLAYSPCGIADRAGGKPLGAKVDWQAANIPEMPNERDLALFGSIGKGWLWGNPESRQRNS